MDSHHTEVKLLKLAYSYYSAKFGALGIFLGCEKGKEQEKIHQRCLVWQLHEQTTFTFLQSGGQNMEESASLQGLKEQTNISSMGSFVSSYHSTDGALVAKGI